MQLKYMRLRVIKTKCPKDAAVLKDFIEQNRVYDFLVGLNLEFDQVRIQILGKQEVPCFNEVVALIRGEESQMSVMLEPQTLDGSILVAKTEYSEQGKNDLPKHLDSDATNHMTSKSQLFHTYTPSPSNKKIAVANGSLATFPKVYSREKVIPEQKQVQESNSDVGNETTVRSNPPLHTQLGETSTDSTNDSLPINLDLPIAVRKGTKECTNRPLYPLSHYVSLKHLSPAHKNFIVSLNTTIIHNTVFEALTKIEWNDAMREEMSALEKNKTWEIVEKSKKKNIVDCKWIFTLKYKADGFLERHKAGLVAKWYTQTYGVDYQETYAPVAKMNTVRILLSLAVHYNWAWFGRFAKVMKEFGYRQSQGDHTLFIKHSVARE
ncbi:hypothetical protein AAG906_016088 [Vitis piasezkii]